MAQPAKRDPRDWQPATRQQPAGSGVVHGPVAEMHRTIEAAMQRPFVTHDLAIQPLGPVETALRSLSRMVGWATLASAFALVGILLH